MQTSLLYSIEVSNDRIHWGSGWNINTSDIVWPDDGGTALISVAPIGYRPWLVPSSVTIALFCPNTSAFTKVFLDVVSAVNADASRMPLTRIKPIVVDTSAVTAADEPVNAAKVRV